MKLHLNKDADLNLVTSYAADRITVGETTYATSLILAPQQLIAPWGTASAQALGAADFTLMLDLDPEVLLLGTGRRLHFPPPAITRGVFEQSVGLEVMTTAAACRTYNILANEGRRVIAALIIEAAHANAQRER